MKNAFVAIGLLSIGFAAGAAFMRHYYKRRFEKELNDAIDELQEYYGYEEEDEEPEDDIFEESDEPEYREIPDTAPPERKVFRTEVEKLKYSNIFDVYKESEDSDFGFAEEEAPVERAEAMEKPYIISHDKFYSNAEGYDKTTLTYYENGDILAEDDDILDEVDMVVGDEFRDHFGDEEADVVYVRNEKLGTDYEIIRDHSSMDVVADIFGFDEE